MIKALKRLVKNGIAACKVYAILSAKEGTISDDKGFHSGIVRDSELAFLKELVEESNALPGPIIEIGTLFGHSARKMARWKSPEKKLITVDDYSWNPYSLDSDSHFKLTRHILSPLIKNSNVIQINMHKNEFYKTYSGETPAMVFLDAIHTYEETKADIDWAIRIGARMICGHDYSKDPTVRVAVDESGGLAKLHGSVWRLRKNQ